MNSSMIAPGSSVRQWMDRPVIPTHIANDIRAALPAWFLTWAAPCAVLLLASQAEGTNEELTEFAAAGLYAIGAAILGANTFGAEFSQRTIALLLVQPISRLRILARKAGILAFFLGTSILPLAWFVEVSRGFPQLELVSAAPWHDPLDVMMWTAVAAAANAFCLAPCLALLTRSALAGAVFSILAFLMIQSTGIFEVARGPLRLYAPEFLWLGLPVLGIWGCAIAGTVRQVLAFQDVTPGILDLTSASWPARAESGTGVQAGRLWWRQLIAKEIRLQRVPFLMAAVFCAIWMVLALTSRWDARYLAYLPGAMAVYTVLVSVAAGALTAAEERQLGTLEWQLALPLRARTQWLVKAAVALGVAFVFGAALPWLLFKALPLQVVREDLAAMPVMLSILALVLSVLSLYVSSISTTTVRAVVITLLVITALWLTAGFPRMLRDGFWWTAFLVLPLWAGFGNFRRVDLQLGRILAQGAALILAYHLLRAIIDGQVLL